MLRVMTFNVLFGGGDRFPAIERLLAASRPDLLVLQECLGWEAGDRLARAAAAIGVPCDDAHAVLGRARPRGSGARYHVAVFSRRPLGGVRTHADPRVLGHCVVQFEIATGVGKLTGLGTHFDSHGEDPRLAEVRFVSSLAAAGDFAGGLWFLAGDLNALSSADPYPPDFAAKLRQAGTDKYGHPPRFDAIRGLEAGGWVDTLRRRPRRPEWVTAPRDRGGVRIDYRTDFVFCSPRLADRLVGAEVVDAAGASDHHAVVADFDV